MNGGREDREGVAGQISEKLDRVIGLMAIQGKDPDAQINTLYALGFNSAKIRSLMAISPNIVRGRKHRRKTVKSTKVK